MNIYGLRSIEYTAHEGTSCTHMFVNFIFIKNSRDTTKPFLLSLNLPGFSFYLYMDEQPLVNSVMSDANVKCALTLVWDEGLTFPVVN